MVELTAKDKRYIELFGEEWFYVLKKEFEKQYFLDLASFISTNRQYLTVYPDKELLFNSYKITQPSNIKVVIIGQEPYCFPLQAHGLAFSADDECMNIPPALKLIAKSIEDSIYDGLNIGWENNLERWGKQGVFLLNRILTVNAKKPNSHEGKGWEQFTKNTIEIINEKYDNIIFLLLGTYVQNSISYINVSKHKIIMVEHPAAALYLDREWNYRNCWNEINKLLEKNNKEKIIW